MEYDWVRELQQNLIYLWILDEHRRFTIYSYPLLVPDY